MRFFLLSIVLSAWALWFGGTISTFVFVTYLFQAHPSISGEAASAIFVIFGEYEMILAGIAMVATGGLLAARPSKPLVLLVACLLLSSAMAMTSGLGFTPRMETLRLEGKSKTDEFRRLHKKSMMAMTAQSVMLLVSGGVLMSAIGDVKLKHETDLPKTSS